MQSFALEKMERRVAELEAERDQLLAENAELRELREKIRDRVSPYGGEIDDGWND